MTLRIRCNSFKSSSSWQTAQKTKCDEQSQGAEFLKKKMSIRDHISYSFSSHHNSRTQQGLTESSGSPATPPLSPLEHLEPLEHSCFLEEQWSICMTQEKCLLGIHNQCFSSTQGRVKTVLNCCENSQHPV